MRNKGFTLIEIITAMAVASIVLIAGFKLINVSFRGTKVTNVQYDVKMEVGTSLKNVENIIKQSRQIFFVGKEVIDGSKLDDGGYLDKIDNGYDYIVLKEDKKTGNKFLVNLVWEQDKKTNSGQWVQIPLTSEGKVENASQNELYDGKTSFDLKFYKGINDYNDLMSRKIINIYIQGKTILPNNKEVEYDLNQDIEAKNVNQILVSQHLLGGMDDVTGFAYSRKGTVKFITEGRKSNDYAIAFIIDLSYSMIGDMSGDRSAPYSRSRIKILKDALLNDKDGFLHQLSTLDVPESEKSTPGEKAKVQTYFVPFSDRAIYHNRNYADKSTMQYLKNCNVGPYNLCFKDDFNTAKSFINNMELDDATNTGEGFLQALYILKNSNKKNKYLIFLSDGIPTKFSYNNKNLDYGYLEFYLNSRRYNRYSRIIKDISGDYADMYYNGMTGTNSVIVEYQRSIYAVTASDDIRDCTTILLSPYNYSRNAHCDYSRTRNKYPYINLVATKDMSMDYCKFITDPRQHWNEKLTKVFLIGFSNVASDKARIGFDKKLNSESFYAYFKQSPDLQTKNNEDPVSVHDVGDKETLIKTLTEIKNSVAADMNMFEGPNAAN